MEKNTREKHQGKIPLFEIFFENLPYLDKYRLNAPRNDKKIIG